MACVRIGDDQLYHITSANCAVVDSLEPGSVAKVVTISAGLNEGLVTPDTTLSVPGFLLFNKDATNEAWRQRIDDAHIHDEMPMTVHEILVESSNVGTVKISQMLQPELQYKYLTDFGFGTKSDLNFPGESVGILPPWQEWEGTEKVTKSYGYGVSATAIQLVSAINVIANGGVYVAPRLVKDTISGDGTVMPAAAPATHQVLTPEVAQQTNIIMRDVVCNGTAKAAQIEGVTVAGKTGTGIKAINGVYPTLDSQKKYYSSFVGFFPAENPAATVLVSIDEPPSGTNNRFGGTAAAPVFQRVVPTIMHQLGIQPGSANGGCPNAG
jgi:cell division protein FtsI (penicillin-binding protein 3)